MEGENILDAPCFYCGYNGKGYWQKGTHAQACPFNRIGGEMKRKRFLTDMEDIRQRLPRLEFHKRSTTKYFNNYEAVTPIGGYRVREARYADDAMCDFGWGLWNSMFTGLIHNDIEIDTKEEAFEACQRDFEERMLQTLGILPEGTTLNPKT